MITVGKDDWKNQFQVSYASGPIVHSFQEDILLFALTLLVQIVNFIKGEKIFLSRLIVGIIIRMIYLFILDINVGSGITLYFKPIYYKAFFPVLVCLLYIFDGFIRLFTIFAFIRMSLMGINEYITDFINTIGTESSTQNRLEDKIRAHKLLKIAVWGTYFLSICSFFEYFATFFIFIGSINRYLNFRAERILFTDSIKSGIHITTNILIIVYH